MKIFKFIILFNSKILILIKFCSYVKYDRLHIKQLIIPLSYQHFFQFDKISEH